MSLKLQLLPQDAADISGLAGQDGRLLSAHVLERSALLPAASSRKRAEMRCPWCRKRRRVQTSRR